MNAFHKLPHVNDLIKDDCIIVEIQMIRKYIQAAIFSNHYLNTLHNFALSGCLFHLKQNSSRTLSFYGFEKKDDEKKDQFHVRAVCVAHTFLSLNSILCIRDCNRMTMLLIYKVNVSSLDSHMF